MVYMEQCWHILHSRCPMDRQFHLHRLHRLHRLHHHLRLLLLPLLLLLRWFLQQIRFRLLLLLLQATVVSIRLTRLAGQFERGKLVNSIHIPALSLQGYILLRHKQLEALTLLNLLRMTLVIFFFQIENEKSRDCYWLGKTERKKLTRTRTSTWIEIFQSSITIS